MTARSCVHAHPERATIEFELARCHRVRDVADKWGIPRRTLADYRQRHMTQEQVARLRGLAPEQAEIDIDEIVRRGGREALLALSRLYEEIEQDKATARTLKDFQTVAKFAGLQVKINVEKAKIANLFPGAKGKTTNNVVIADGAAVFALVDRVLAQAATVHDARAMLASEFREQGRPLLEHAA